MQKRWSGKSIEATFRTQEGFEKTMIVLEFRYDFVIPIRRDILSFSILAPEPIEKMDTGLDRKTFYFEKWLNDEKTKALYLAK